MPEEPKPRPKPRGWGGGANTDMRARKMQPLKRHTALSCCLVLSCFDLWFCCVILSCCLVLTCCLVLWLLSCDCLVVFLPRLMVILSCLVGVMYCAVLSCLVLLLRCVVLCCVACLVLFCLVDPNPIPIPNPNNDPKCTRYSSFFLSCLLLTVRCQRVKKMSLVVRN
jgi:hypothetical protein